MMETKTECRLILQTTISFGLLFNRFNCKFGSTDCINNETLRSAK